MRGRVTEDQLIGVLDQVEAAEAQGGGGAPTAPSRKITVRPSFFESRVGSRGGQFSRKDAFDDDDF